MAERPRSPDAAGSTTPAFLFPLVGDSRSLEQFASKVATLGFAVVNDGDARFLELDDCDFDTTDDRVLTLAAMAARRANILAAVEFPNNYKKVIVGRSVIRHFGDGRRSVRVYGEVAIGIFERLAVSKAGSNEERTDASEPAEVTDSELVALLSAENVVIEVAEYLRFSDNWAFDLYKAYELIGDDVSRERLGPHYKNTASDRRIRTAWDWIVSEKWVDSDSLIRFRTSVNNPGALGVQARHAVESSKMNREPITKAEAIALIDQVFWKWLRWKYAKRNLASGTT